MIAFKDRSPTRPGRRWISLLLVAMTLFANSASALAAPPATGRSQEQPAPANVDSHHNLYLPTVETDRKPVETLEVDVVHLNQSAATSADKPASAAANGPLLPAPPPGEELYPAQPDVDPSAVATAETAAVRASVM